jgi:hypothetical protein
MHDITLTNLYLENRTKEKLSLFLMEKMCRTLFIALQKKFICLIIYAICKLVISQLSVCAFLNNDLHFFEFYIIRDENILLNLFENQNNIE